MKNDMITLSKEFELLIALAKLALEQEEVEKVNDFIQKNDIDWNELERLSKVHRVFMLIFHGLQTVIPELIDETFLRRIKSYTNRALITNLRLSGELLKLSELLKQNNIEAVFYKGTTFSQQLYNSLNLRNFGDIDFLIDLEDFDKVEKILLGKGYQAEIKFTDAKKKKRHIKTVPEFNFDFTYNDGKKYHVEPHYLFISPVSAIDIRLKDVQKHITTVNFGEKAINTFDIDFIPIILSVHHGAKDGWSLFKHISDWYVLMIKHQNQINWEKVQLLAKQYDIEIYLYISLGLLEKLYNVPIPSLLKERVQNKKIQKKTTQHLIELINNTEGKRIESGYKKLLFRFIHSKKMSTRIKIITRSISFFFIKIRNGNIDETSSS